MHLKVWHPPDHLSFVPSVLTKLFKERGLSPTFWGCAFPR